jgi:hypothetical protein
MTIEQLRLEKEQFLLERGYRKVVMPSHRLQDYKKGTIKIRYSMDSRMWYIPDVEGGYLSSGTDWLRPLVNFKKRICDLELLKISTRWS